MKWVSSYPVQICLINVLVFCGSVAVLKCGLLTRSRFLTRKENAMSHAIVSCIGPAVLDHRVKADTNPPRSGKQECQITENVGGGAVQSARAVNAAGLTARLVTLVGDDAAGMTATRLIRNEFPQAAVVRVMDATRQSIVLGDCCLTQRSTISSARLPLLTRQQLLTSKCCLIAPFAKGDHEFVNWLLTTCPRPTLMLSQSQLSDPQQCADLARHAYCVVLNDHELALWTGEHDSMEAGIRILQERYDLHRIVVTSPTRAVAYVEMQWIVLPSQPVQYVYRTVGAGDTFAGTLTAGLARDLPWKVAIATALHSAARYVQSPEVTPPRPVAIGTNDPPPPHTAPQFKPWIQSLAMCAAGLIGVGLGTLV